MKIAQSPLHLNKYRGFNAFKSQKLVVTERFQRASRLQLSMTISHLALSDSGGRTDFRTVSEVHVVKAFRLLQHKQSARSIKTRYRNGGQTQKHTFLTCYEFKFKLIDFLLSFSLTGNYWEIN